MHSDLRFLIGYVIVMIGIRFSSEKHMIRDIVHQVNRIETYQPSLRQCSMRIISRRVSYPNCVKSLQPETWLPSISKCRTIVVTIVDQMLKQFEVAELAEDRDE